MLTVCFVSCTKIVVIEMIYSVKFHQKFHIIPMVIKLWSQKAFLFTNFHYHLILPLPMVMHWNEFYKENEMIEVGQVWPSKYPRDYSTKIILIFHFHYHRLLLTTKRVVHVIRDNQCFPSDFDECLVLILFF